MNTKIFTKNELSEAAAMIRSGGIVVMPTETVYGLAANALNEEAVKKIYEAKGRQSDNPLIVHIANIGDWAELVTEIPKKAKLLAERFWPGPLTIILKKSNIVPDIVSGGLDTVAVRMPKNKIAFRFIKECGVPIAAPSANLSGKPSPTRFVHVKHDMDGRVDGMIDGGDCAVGIESTVISLVEDIPVILRPGRITAEQIKKVIGEVKIHPAIVRDLGKDEIVASPGMKYKHYAPKADLTLIKGSEQAFADYVNSHANEQTAVVCYDETLALLPLQKTFSLGPKQDSITHAKKLFDILREIDAQGFQKAFAPLPANKGVSLAVENRLLRAAGFQLVDLEKKTPGQSEEAVATAQKEEKEQVQFISPEGAPEQKTQATPLSQAESEALLIQPEKTSSSSLNRGGNENTAPELLYEEDSSILALYDVKLSADFDEDFSKEISDSITVVEKTEEGDPTKIFYEAVIDEDGAKPASYPVDSIGDDFHFDVYDDDIEAERNRGLFGFLKKRRHRNQPDEGEPEPFIPKRNPLWNAEAPLKSTENVKGEAAEEKRVFHPIEGLHVVGITGKSGAGKSYITKKIAAKTEKCAIIDADSLYHTMLESDSMILSLVVAFGSDILTGKKVNRKKLAAVAFSSPENLQKLNATVLPQVAQKIMELLQQAKNKGLKTVFLDAPTLIESKLYQACDEVIFVVADAAIRQERIVQRDNITLDEIGQRMRFEKDDSFYARYANRIIRNN